MRNAAPHAARTHAGLRKGARRTCLRTRRGTPPLHSPISLRVPVAAQWSPAAYATPHHANHVAWHVPRMAGVGVPMGAHVAHTRGIRPCAWTSPCAEWRARSRVEACAGHVPSPLPVRVAGWGRCAWGWPVASAQRAALLVQCRRVRGRMCAPCRRAVAARGARRAPPCRP